MVDTVDFDDRFVHGIAILVDTVDFDDGFVHGIAILVDTRRRVT